MIVFLYILLLYFLTSSTVKLFLGHMATAGQHKCSEPRFMCCVWVALVQYIPGSVIADVNINWGEVNVDIDIFYNEVCVVKLLASTSAHSWGLCVVWEGLVHASGHHVFIILNSKYRNTEIQFINIKEKYIKFHKWDWFTQVPTTS